MKRLSFPAMDLRDELHFNLKFTPTGRGLPNMKRLSLPARDFRDELHFRFNLQCSR